jgi:hypothetical protein
MPRSRLILGTAAVAFCAAAAAQTAQQQPGFFRPKADPDLTSPDRAAQPAPMTSPQAGQVPAQPSSQVPGPAPVAQDEASSQQNGAIASDPTRLRRWTEQQMDRSEQDAARAKAMANTTPAPINGAFTGQTSERDR